MLYAIYRRGSFLPYMPSVLTVMTFLLASPNVGRFRYQYPVMTAAILLCALTAAPAVPRNEDPETGSEAVDAKNPETGSEAVDAKNPETGRESGEGKSPETGKMAGKGKRHDTNKKGAGQP